jgi:hypothetical protein
VQLLFTSEQNEKVYMMKLQCDRGLSFEAAIAKRDEALKDGRYAQFCTLRNKIPASAADGILLALGHGGFEKQNYNCT